ncbi:hypothetical protein RJT34_03205 [Clitoria ternatea]|uniref:Uncharacterized protein n=1 Tax=Clitoria ternatea TaxID=43366 RepID=A0AAN9KLP9_CLITE
MVGQNNRILLVFFFLLCFILIHARARTLKEESNIIANSTRDDNKETRVLKPKEDEDNEGEVLSMDYSPARRKTPIHN